MGILIDSRADKCRDMLQSFINLNGHEGSRVYYPTGTGGQTDFFGKRFGLPRRWFYGPHPVTKKGAWWAFQPKVSQSAQRAEAAFKYEAATVTRFFYWKIHLPSTGPLKWIDDTTTYQAIVGQWHENKQPNGARPPPFEVALWWDPASGKRRMKVTIGHDNGTGASGTGVAPTLIETDMGEFPLDQDIEFAAFIKAEGAATDFLKFWANGTQYVNYSGYIGYPSYDTNNVYNQQNFFKIGTYYYQQHGSPTYRAICQLGLLVGDQTETLTTMRNAWNAAVPVTPHTRTRIAVAVLGGTNAIGINSGAVNRALYGQPCIDPVEPSIFVRASMVPALSSHLAKKGAGAVVFNCAQNGIGMTSLAGRCRGTWAPSTVYLPGDLVTPTVPVPTYTGTGNNRLENGFAFLCEVGGTSGSTEPNWGATAAFGANFTAENQATIEGGITWRAERRETYHTAGKTFEFGDLGFDPLGLVSQALMCVDQTLAADRKILLLMPGLDPAQNADATAKAAAIASVSALAASMGIEVITSAQALSGAVDDGALAIIGRAAAGEIIA